MGRAWFAICKLEAARLASLFREKRYRGIIINLYEMRMKSCRRRDSGENNKATVPAQVCGEGLETRIRCVDNVRACVPDLYRTRRRRNVSPCVTSCNTILPSINQRLEANVSPKSDLCKLPPYLLGT